MGLKRGDLVRVKEKFAPYLGIIRALGKFHPIKREDKCIWVGKDPARKGERTYPAGIVGEVLVEVDAAIAFELIDETG